MRLVTGSCDNTVRFWRYSEVAGIGQRRTRLVTLTPDWVRDVSWAPNVASPGNIVASCGEDQKVYIWKENENGAWEYNLVKVFNAPVWRISWSVTGNVLAVSTGDHVVTLWSRGGWCLGANGTGVGAYFFSVSNNLTNPFKLQFLECLHTQ